MYHLSISMHTDDDCEILYRGFSYCEYGPDLEINEWFESIPELKIFVRNNVKVVAGGKASEFTHEWLAEAVNKLTVDAAINIPGFSSSCTGNQKFEFWVTYNIPVENKPKTYITIDGDSIRLGNAGHIECFNLNQSVDEPAFTIHKHDLRKALHYFAQVDS